MQPLGVNHFSPLSGALAGKKNLLPYGPPNQMQEIWTSFATALPLPLPFPCSPFDSKSANFLGAAVQPLGDDHISPLSAALAGKKNLLPNGPPNQKQEIWRKGSEFLASHLPPWVWNLPMAGKSHLFYNSPSPSPSLPFPCISLPLPSL